MKYFLAILFVIVSAAAGWAQAPVQRNPFTTNNNNMLTLNSYFVSASYGSDSNPGNVSAPWATIGKACSNAVVGSTIYVGPGTYTQGLNRGGVIWEFSEGAIVTGGLAFLAISATNSTNVVIRGKGIFKNTDSNAVLFKDENSSVDLEAKGIQGLFDIYGKDSANTKLLIQNTFIYGSINTEFDFAGSGLCEVTLINCRLYSWDDASAAFPIVLSGCVSKATLSANPLRVGTPLVQTNMDYTINLQ